MWNHIKIIRIIKEHIPFWLRYILVRLLVFLQTIYYRIFPKNGEWGKERKAFVLLSTDYSNLGDHAMTFAHLKMLKEVLPEYKIYEVLVGDTIKSLFGIQKVIGKDDIITLKGGGNIGIEYYREELIRRKIIRTFPQTRIIMFPQTVYFPNTKLGKEQFDKTVETFNCHRDFHAFFRDKVSYDMMANRLSCNKYLTPDIVFSLKTININSVTRHGAVTCLRKDVEGIYSENDKEIVYSALESVFGADVTYTDTIKDYQILTEDRETELHAMWETIANTKLLITDRLHGMIFAALLGTPCIVLNTYNHKLRGQYEWIKNLNYIYCIDLDNKKLKETITKALNTKVVKIDSEIFNQYFLQIKECLRGNNG